MNHSIPVAALGSSGPPMARAIEACVHCGFCLPACPTYRVLGEEMDSPRGRILLMKNALEGTVTIAQTLPFVDRCLGCLSCVTACPSGVRYDELLPLYRDRASAERQRTPVERLTHLLVHETLPYTQRARLALTTGRLAKPFASLLPKSMGAMLGLVPDAVPPAHPLPSFTPAVGPRRARVALLTGCVQAAIAPEIGHATVRVLARNGVDVVVPQSQGCCGALAMHAGDLSRARDLAAPFVGGDGHGIFPDDVDAIVTNAAGCGSAMKEYGLLFAGRPEEARARALAGRVRDISEFLAALGLAEVPPPLATPLTVAYHDACHLAHAQRVTAAPRELLRQIGNLTIAEIEEGEICCGSAGTYNIEQPDIAATLGARKARHVVATGAQAVVAGNIGCLVQLRTALAREGRPLPVWHTIELLDRAYQGQPTGPDVGPR